MNSHLLLKVFLCGLLLVPFSARTQPPSISRMQCEYLDNPLGIDNAQPRLSWELNDKRTGAKQLAYQVFVDADSGNVSHSKGIFWQTSKINKGSQLVSYNGKKLNPFSKYYWTIKAWDKDGKAFLSPVASFETGMMQMSNWKGTWIRDTRDINLKPAAYFRKKFVSDKKIISARVYIAVAGLYECYINGDRVGDHQLDPMYTRFDRRNLYVTYDVTTQVKQGDNEIRVLLGNGWYNHQSHAVWNFDEAYWRARPTFCLDLRISYSDGSIETISSGEDWTAALSPVIFNSIYTGEHVDARLENIPDSAWQLVMICSAPSQNIVSQAMQPIRLGQEMPAKSIHAFSDTVYVFDIGRNISGVSKIKVYGQRGTIIRLKHGERLYSNGRVDQSNIDVHYRPLDNTDPFQTDIYILKGDPHGEVFMPRFNYKGFQYVEVTSNKSINLNKESLTAYFMHSDVHAVGKIASSNEIINKIWEATNNSYLSNLMGYPTDCPQREKNGWTGDAQIAIETGLYNFDGITIYEKWLADHRDEQQPNGILPSIVPTSVWGYEWGNGPDWTSTVAIIPWNLYLFYGDSKCLSDCYGNIKRYVDHIDELYPSGLCSWGLGDWVPVKSKTPLEFTSTAYYYADASILAKAAKLFGKQDDYKKYNTLAQKIKDAFNAKYLYEEKGIYGTGLQTELSVVLYWGLVPDRLKSTIAASLAKRVIEDSTKLDVGLLGTKAILNALSENGYGDLAYQLASGKTEPSWGWWIVNGATTLYENWPLDAQRDLSLNHIMFGEIGAWFYKALGGIRPDPASPGFKNILLHPYFVAGLDSFSASHTGPRGEILSSWKRKENEVAYSVTIPANSTATLTLNVENKKSLYKNGIEQPVIHQLFHQSLPAGTYTFLIK